MSAAVLALSGLGSLAVAVAVAAAPTVATPLSIDGAAVASAPAQRLRVVPPQNFPMETSPRCEILDNFADPRSGGRLHQGIDILANEGQEVYAMVDGTLTGQAIAGSGNAGAVLSGNLWRLTAADGTYYVYGHLSAFAPGLTKGSTVYKGQIIGYVGDTGNSGPGNYHLHFEIHPGGGIAVDPLPLLRPLPAACKVYG